MNRTINKAFARWWLRILILGAGFSISMLLASIVTILFFDFSPQDYLISWSLSSFTDPYILLNTFFMSLFTFALCIIIERLRAGGSLRTLGLWGDDYFIRNNILGFALSIGSITLILFAAILIGAEYQINELNLPGQIGFLLFIFFGVINEEITFRGILQQAFEKPLGPNGAILLNAIIFSVFHLFNPFYAVMPVVNVFLAGLLLGILYKYSGSLYLPIAFHLWWNYGTVLLLGSNLSGMSMNYASVIELNYESLPEIIFGGYFGVEGGIICSVLLVIAILIGLKYVREAPTISAALFKRKLIESELLNRK